MEQLNGDLEFHNKNVLYAYRLSDGEELWSDTISHYTRWGWNKVQYLPETGNYLVWADQLMLIDPQTGVVKRMNVNTGRYGVPVGLSKKDHSTNHNLMPTTPSLLMSTAATGQVSSRISPSRIISSTSLTVRTSTAWITTLT